MFNAHHLVWMLDVLALAGRDDALLHALNEWM